MLPSKSVFAQSLLKEENIKQHLQQQRKIMSIDQSSILHPFYVNFVGVKSYARCVIEKIFM